MTKVEMQNLVDTSINLNSLLKNAVKDALIKIGHPVEFNWDDDLAPVISSNSFTKNDLADSYITKIWLDEDKVMVNLHSFYLGEDRENIDLQNEYDVDYADILTYLIEEIDE